MFLGSSSTVPQVRTAYPLIYADPPVMYRDQKLNRGGAARHYQTLSMARIVEHLEQFADPEGCALCCWTTWPTEDDLRSVLKAAGWQLRRPGLLVWVKTTSRGTPAWGMGSYTRCNTEVVHLWTRGRHWPRRMSAGVHEVILAPRGPHSAKPPEARRRLERLFGDLPRIELYARGSVPGWDVWGNEC